MEWAKNMLPWALPLIPILPALAFALLVPWSREMRAKLKWVSLGLSVATLLLALIAFAATLPGGEELPVYHQFWPIANIGNSAVGFGLLLNTRVALMLLVVSIVAVCVQVYSIEYMHDEPRIGWYYAVVSLFTAAMLSLVLADNYLMLYMAWELMGLCSYLLIGFWYQDEGPRQASMKAFLTTRVGDIGLGLGLAWIWAMAGSFQYERVFATVGDWPTWIITGIALLLFMGAMGKSAQFPLHVWLPDAMAGPTPASALIHAATMVAAGVWLVLVSTPIFSQSIVALRVVEVVGGITVIVGGLLAMVQHDVKKVLAYSTISQLGLMFLAFGGGAYEASFFHLVTHAFFKAPLFLGAGVIIHAAHTQDMREMNGLLKATPWTAAAFSIGTLALIGVPTMSGFFSKDEILAGLWHGQHYVAFGIALFGAVLTAFYMTRLWLRIFPGNPDDTVHEGPALMVAPTMTLAVITVVLGLPLTPYVARYLTGVEWEGIVWPIAATALSVALVGIAIGWVMYGRRDARGYRTFDTEPLKHNYLYAALENKLYIDLTYEYFLIRPYFAITAWLADFFDPRVIDGAVNGAAAAWVAFSYQMSDVDQNFIDRAVNGVAAAVQIAGDKMRTVQSGRVQTYQRLILAALVVLIIWAVLRGA